jgi:hypothetical protein
MGPNWNICRAWNRRFIWSKYVKASDMELFSITSKHKLLRNFCEGNTLKYDFT